MLRIKSATEEYLLGLYYSPTVANAGMTMFPGILDPSLRSG